MSFCLVDAGWRREFADALAADGDRIRIVCPFIKEGAIRGLLGRRRPRALEVITRFNLADFSGGVSDIRALELLLQRGARIRGIKNLHAKMYLFGESRAIVTSANLTDAALSRNHEFGFVVTEPGAISECRRYFDGLWNRAGQDLQTQKLDEWNQRVTSHQCAGGWLGSAGDLGDEGTDLGIPAAEVAGEPQAASQADQAFVKFFGTSKTRANRQMAVLEEVRSSDCHLTCAYPPGKRPRIVQDGALIFVARLVSDPNDIMVYGHAIGVRYVEGRDDASEADIQRLPWKQDWPHLVRVHDGVFLRGCLGDGVSLNALMKDLGASVFAATQRNAQAGRGNTDPRRAYLRQAAVELTPKGRDSLSRALGLQFRRVGKLSAKDLSSLYWPNAPSADAPPSQD